MKHIFPWAVAVLIALALNGCASIDLSCGGKTYTVGTGNGKGECKSSGQNAVCADNAGNSAEVSCASGCTSSKGSGSCSVKQ